jgi:uncharacterized protein YceK
VNEDQGAQKMVMQLKSQACKSTRAMGQRFIGLRFINTCALALLCGSVISACSGTIDTPSQEYPARQADDDSAAGGTSSSPPRASNSTASAGTASTPPRAASNAADDDAPAADDETPAAADEDPPAADDEPAAATTDLAFETDIWPIFQTDCGPCHVSANLGGQNIGNADVDAAFADATRTGDRVVIRIEAGGMPPACSGGAPGDSGCVSEDDLQKIKDWYAAGAPE